MPSSSETAGGPGSGPHWTSSGRVSSLRRSVERAAPADIAEDTLPSIASGVVGTAFAAAYAARLLTSAAVGRGTLVLAGLALSVAVPMAMGVVPEFRGLLQRIMFRVSFVFVAGEFIRETAR